MVSGALLKGSDWSDSKCLNVMFASATLKFIVVDMALAQICCLFISGIEVLSSCIDNCKTKCARKHEMQNKHGS